MWYIQLPMPSLLPSAHLTYFNLHTKHMAFDWRGEGEGVYAGSTLALTDTSERLCALESQQHTHAETRLLVDCMRDELHAMRLTNQELASKTEILERTVAELTELLRTTVNSSSATTTQLGAQICRLDDLQLSVSVLTNAWTDIITHIQTMYERIGQLWPPR